MKEVKFYLIAMASAVLLYGAGYGWGYLSNIPSERRHPAAMSACVLALILGTICASKTMKKIDEDFWDGKIDKARSS